MTGPRCVGAVTGGRTCYVGGESHGNIMLTTADHVCIYCMGPSGEAKGQEHVVPHSLGNEDWMLPRGAVCDTCNSHFGKRVDQPFVDAGFGAFRSVLGVPGPKKNRPTMWTLPKGTGTLHGELLPRGERVMVQGFPNSKAKSREMRARAPVAEGTLSITRPPRERESAFLSRLLLATVGIFLGPGVALQPGLDLHRENMREAAPKKHLPFLFETRSAGPVAYWTLCLYPDGLLFEMWNIVKYGIAVDGKYEKSRKSNDSRKGFSFVGMYGLTGGPVVWPRAEWVRRLGPEGKDLLEP